jgi:hypothetical protein
VGHCADLRVVDLDRTRELFRPGATSPAVASAQADSAKAFCRQLKSSSSTADLLVQGALVATPEGLEYGGGSGLADALVKQRGHRFVGAEPLGNTCWAYAELKGTTWNKPFHLKWRCAVRSIAMIPPSARVHPKNDRRHGVRLCCLPRRFIPPGHRRRCYKKSDTFRVGREA